MSQDKLEYEICTRRGHEPSGISETIGWETWQRCRWCNTEYRFGEPRLIEREAPEPAWILDSAAAVIESLTVSAPSVEQDKK